MSETIHCPICKTPSPDMNAEMSAEQVRLLHELVDSSGWKVYREVVRTGALRATDRLLCERDATRLVGLRHEARLWIYFSQFEDWVREVAGNSLIESDAVAAALQKWHEESSEAR